MSFIAEFRFKPGDLVTTNLDQSDPMVIIICCALLGGSYQYTVRLENGNIMDYYEEELQEASTQCLS